jgi:hypothetical protein
MQAVLAVALIAICGPGFAAKGGEPGPPTGGETPNNLSVPGILTESDVSTEAYWSVNTVAPEFKVQYSYGCDLEESYGEFKYPNTSCVDDLMEPTIYYTPEECVLTGNPCAGLEAEDVFRIYWQKEPLNEWWATDDGKSPDSIPVAYVDWGDALEAVSWSERSVVRVETQPWASTIPGYSPTIACVDAAVGDPEVDCKVGFQMWHVSGQGITEHWGVRASNLDEAVSYNFDSPFQIIKTTNARLNVTKMVEGDAICSQPGGNPGDDPPAVGGWNGAEWGGTCTVYDQPYTVETSVGGKYVYGYNLRMAEVFPHEVCGESWVKTGFYRLTFYAPNDVDFTGHTEANPIPNVAPPYVPSDERTLPRDGIFNTVVVPPAPEPVVEAESDEEDPDADDRLYRPVIDPVHNLTYLDICIVAKSQGGGGGGGGGGGPGGGGGGGGGHAADSADTHAVDGSAAVGARGGAKGRGRGSGR